MDAVAVWLGAICTLAIYSFIYGDNPVYRFWEHVFVALGAGHMTVMGYESIVSRAWTPLMQGDWWWLGAIVGGVLLLLRLFPATKWISRIPLGFMMGVAAATTFRRAIDAEFWAQLRATIQLTWTSPNNILFIVFTVTSLSYFLFTYDPSKTHGRILTASGKVGQYVMMIAFGASLGSMIMARLSLLIGRLEFLLGDWLGLL